MDTSRQGFTLIETVIGLAIVCSLLVVSVWNLKDYQARIEERESLEWFKNSFKNEMNYSYLNRKPAYLKIRGDHVTFGRHAVNGKIILKKKIFPKSLRNTNGPIDYFIGKSGQSAPKTIIFESKLTHRKYEYRIQMGWGEIIEKTQRIYPS